jgi:hypothetical protein
MVGRVSELPLKTATLDLGPRIEPCTGWHPEKAACCGTAAIISCHSATDVLGAGGVVGSAESVISAVKELLQASSMVLDSLIHQYLAHALRLSLFPAHV